MLSFWLQIRRVLKTFISIFKDEEGRAILFMTGLLLLTGSLFYRTVEGFKWIDALYFSFTTLTTIGYRDFVPTTTIGKVFTMLYSLIGLGVVSSFVVTVATHYQDLSRRNTVSKTDGK
ncbi:potassium channel family protein [Streptococcus ruminantium]|uniref:potassium channel family protein n=1 Tax=Streptococcus ruminantium TaxID=1917441 RepID=UPI0012DCBF3A|nr:potassium channel family protein [Streptococcus ruminantium]